LSFKFTYAAKIIVFHGDANPKSSLCLIFFHLLAWKPNIEQFSIYLNKFFHIFNLSESNFACQTPYQWFHEPPTHGILNPLLMVFLHSPTHGISNPLSMVFWIPYPWYFEPLYPWYFESPIHGILNPLPMVFRIPYPWYFEPFLYPWYFESPIHGILNPLPMVKMRGSIYNDGVQKAMTNLTLG
jgi:hypothetical protein